MDTFDIATVGFGPSSLAVAIALRDRGLAPRIAFVERNVAFGWHPGMLLPGARMQISYLKDLATMRDPTSPFTFLNYLHRVGRLAAFSNLDTHAPLREEFNDYLGWCAAQFKDLVQYGSEVVAVRPAAKATTTTTTPSAPIPAFELVIRDVKTGAIRLLRARHVIVAPGGQPAIPPGVAASLNTNPPHLPAPLVHSADYLCRVHSLLPAPLESYRCAVIGGGQSAVEIAEDLGARFPHAQVALYLREGAMRPSDDSPFVNEIFDPSAVDSFFALDPAARRRHLADNRATNYSVVRLSLLESLYLKLYRQRVLMPDPAAWPLRLHPYQDVVGVDVPASSSSSFTPTATLRLRDTTTDTVAPSPPFNLIIFATGYRRNPFAHMLRPLASLVAPDAPGGHGATDGADGTMPVDRQYRVQFAQGAVAPSAGVWLQGSCEASHGLSDSLLSILAVRSNELVDSIMAADVPKGKL